VILVLSDEERKAYQKKYHKKYYSDPKVKARIKKNNARPEVKARQKEYNKKYHLTPESRVKQKERRDRPEVKAREKARSATSEYRVKQKERRERPEVKAREKARRATPEYNAREKARRATPEYKARVRAKEKERQSVPGYEESERKRKREWSQSHEGKAYRKEYYAKPETKAKTKSKRDSERLEVLQYYSKWHSKSNIPCCRCCGENFHVDFLAVDHIAGWKKMDFEPELVELGYSSSMGTNNLMHWLIVNNFPTGFQILCHKCNFAKGIIRNNKRCPHQK
jgi:hypothetical protein